MWNAEIITVFGFLWVFLLPKETKVWEYDMTWLFPFSWQDFFKSSILFFFNKSYRMGEATWEVFVFKIVTANIYAISLGMHIAN